MAPMVLVLMLQIVFKTCVETKAISVDSLNDELRYLQTDLSLFTGESMVKEELIVKEILELKRSVFLLKGMINITNKGTRDIEDDSKIQAEGSKTMNDKILRLENKIDSLIIQNNEKDTKVQELEVKVKKLQLQLEAVQRK